MRKNILAAAYPGWQPDLVAIFYLTPYLLGPLENMTHSRTYMLTPLPPDRLNLLTTFDHG